MNTTLAGKLFELQLILRTNAIPKNNSELQKMALDLELPLEYLDRLDIIEKIECLIREGRANRVRDALTLCIRDEEIKKENEKLLSLLE